jgi:hypothetical protein
VWVRSFAVWFCNSRRGSVCFPQMFLDWRRCVMRTVGGSSMHNAWSEQFETRASIRDRGTRLFHLQLPRSGFFALSHSFHSRWLCDGSLAVAVMLMLMLMWRAQDRRRAHWPSRYPVTGVPFRVVRALIRSVFACSGLLLVLRHRLVAGVRSSQTCHVECQCHAGCRDIGRANRRTTARTLRSSRFLSRWRGRFPETPSRDRSSIPTA